MDSKFIFSCYEIETMPGDAIVIPAIKSFDLENLGVISKASLTFSQRVTFILRELPALGETTLMWAMGAAAGAALPERLLRNEDGSALRIRATWKGEPVEVGSPPLGPSAPDWSAMGERTIAALSHLFARVGKGQCVLLDSDCFGHLDQRHRTNAFRLIEESPTQVIAFFPHRFLEEIPRSLRTGPVYKIVPDPSDNKRSCIAEIEL